MRSNLYQLYACNIIINKFIKFIIINSNLYMLYLFVNYKILFHPARLEFFKYKILRF